MANETNAATLQAGLNPASATAEEVQAYINIATDLLRDLLLARGWTKEQWNEYRKRITAEEISFIDSEIARLGGTTEEIPS